MLINAEHFVKLAQVITPCKGILLEKFKILTICGL